MLNETTLKQKRTAATREHILGAAFDLLVEHPDQPFSHEAVAKAAGVGDRTVYRYFPTQADLFEALWLQVREQSGTVFPNAEAEIVPQLTVLYRAFDRNEKLIRATLQSPAGARIRAQGTAEGRTGFDNSLHELTRNLGPTEKRHVRAVFQGIHSAPFWQMLRDRGGLSGSEAAAAAAWAAQSLLDSLRRTRKNSQTAIKTKQRGRSK
jgi:AcrR family transcriptional regulator